MKMCVARWRVIFTAAAAVVVISVTINLVALSLRDSDKIEATRALVAWIVKGRSVPGFGKPYPDSEFMQKQKRFVVICDFIPPEISLSDDARVQRVTEQEHEAYFAEHGYDDTDYLTIELKLESRKKLVLHVSNMFGSLGGHGFSFEFRRTLNGLRASGRFLWVS